MNIHTLHSYSNQLSTTISELALNATAKEQDTIACTWLINSCHNYFDGNLDLKDICLFNVQLLRQCQDINVQQYIDQPFEVINDEFSTLINIKKDSLRSVSNTSSHNSRYKPAMRMIALILVAIGGLIVFGGLDDALKTLLRM
jgi:hypothetical protein